MAPISPPSTKTLAHACEAIAWDLCFRVSSWCPHSPRLKTCRCRSNCAAFATVTRAHAICHFPTQLSGGEQQRVAIARAFVNRPRVLFADEPTGNLDGATGEKIVALLEQLNREDGTTVVLVTHDPKLATRLGRSIRLADGVIIEDTGAVTRVPAEAVA
jgi:ABC-type lipoprotein export system ATPase subunit